MNIHEFDWTQAKLTISGMVVSFLSFIQLDSQFTSLANLDFWFSKEGVAAIMGFGVSIVVIWMNIETIKLRRAERKKVERENKNS